MFSHKHPNYFDAFPPADHPGLDAIRHAVLLDMYAQIRDRYILALPVSSRSPLPLPQPANILPPESTGIPIHPPQPDHVLPSWPTPQPKTENWDWDISTEDSPKMRVGDSVKIRSLLPNERQWGPWSSAIIIEKDWIYNLRDLKFPWYRVRVDSTDETKLVLGLLGEVWYQPDREDPPNLGPEEADAILRKLEKVFVHVKFVDPKTKQKHSEWWPGTIKGLHTSNVLVHLTPAGNARFGFLRSFKADYVPYTAAAAAKLRESGAVVASASDF